MIHNADEQFDQQPEANKSHGRKVNLGQVEYSGDLSLLRSCQTWVSAADSLQALSDVSQ